MMPKFNQLPDYISVDELKKHFAILLDVIENTENINLESAAESLRELADRQWHTYELIDPKLGERIEQWIINNWNVVSRNFVMDALFVVGALGLKKGYELIKMSRDQKMSMEIRRAIETLILQIERNDGHIEDPYYGLR